MTLFSFKKFSWPLTLQNSVSGRSYNYGFYTDSKSRTPERECTRITSATTTYVDVS
jgi:hypothetical protein